MRLSIAVGILIFTALLVLYFYKDRLIAKVKKA